MAALILFMTVLMVFALSYGFMVKRYTDAVFFFLVLCTFRHLPAFLFVFGIDSGNEMLLSMNVDNAALKLGLVFSVFMSFLLIGYAGSYNSGAGAFLFPRWNYKRSDFLVVVGLSMITSISIVVVSVPLLQTGSILGAIHAIRFAGFYTGYSFLINFIWFGTIISAAFAADISVRSRRGDAKAKRYMTVAFTLFALNIFTAIMLGGKGIVVFTILVVVLTHTLLISKTPIRSLILPGMAIVLLIFILQFARITLVQGSSISNAPTLYNALHLNVFDTNLIYLDVLGDQYDPGFAGNFSAGLAGVIPRFLWPNKPANITAGGDFKRTIKPDAEGGWPVLAYNQWFGSFGWLGVVAGGLLTGWIISAIHYRTSRHKHDAFAIVIGYMLIQRFLSPTGINNEIFINYVLVVLPLFVFAGLTHEGWLRKDRNSILTT